MIDFFEMVAAIAINNAIRGNSAEDDRKAREKQLLRNLRKEKRKEEKERKRQEEEDLRHRREEYQRWRETPVAKACLHMAVKYQTLMAELEQKGYQLSLDWIEEDELGGILRVDAVEKPIKVARAYYGEGTAANPLSNDCVSTAEALYEAVQEALEDIKLEQCLNNLWSK
jgi:hypothetical protein